MTTCGDGRPRPSSRAKLGRNQASTTKPQAAEFRAHEDRREGATTPPRPSSPRFISNLLLPPSPVIDPNQPSLSVRIRAVTAPPPLIGLLRQPAHHRIPVHVSQLLHNFPLTPHVEVIKPPLPELPRGTARRPPTLRKSQLHRLHHHRRVLAPGSGTGRFRNHRLGNQQVHMLRHDDIPEDGKAVSLGHPFEHVQE